MSATFDLSALARDSGRLWAENWHLLAHRSEVADNHAFVRFNVAGREVVVYNDGASVIAFDNRCPHRGARIFDGDAGKERFLCRYHGWSYAKGKVFVADRDSLSHCPLDRLALNTLQVAWCGDFLFASPAPEHSLDDQLAGLAATLEAISHGIGHRWDINRYAYEADWRIALENALEPYHVANIHRDTLDTLKLQPGTNRYFGRNSIWSAPLGDDRMARRLQSLSRLFDLPYRFEGYESIYIFPFTMISSTFGYSQSLQNFLPGSECGRTHFTSRLFSGRAAATAKPHLVEPLMASSAVMNRSVFDEDHAICRRVPLDSWSKDDPVFWSASEEKLLHFRKSYREATSRA